MRKGWIFCLLFTILTLTANAQSFANYEELLGVSKMDPLAIEKMLTQKGFKFESTDGNISSYQKGKDELFSYQTNPKIIVYNTASRIFYLDVNSTLIKKGYKLESANAVIREADEDNFIDAIHGQKYVKGNYSVYLWVPGNDSYAIMIESNKSKGTSNNSSTGDEESVDYGMFYVAPILPRGIIKEEPTLSNTYTQMLGGDAGIGAKTGFEIGLEGFVGLKKINRFIPDPFNIGIFLGGRLALQPYTLESVSALYEDYHYSAFGRVGYGMGPALIIAPAAWENFRLSAYYKWEAAIAFGGSFNYTGSQEFRDEVTRKNYPFALVKSYGVNLSKSSIAVGVEFTSYTDESEFFFSREYKDNNSVQIKQYYPMYSRIPFQQTVLKIGLAF